MFLMTSNPLGRPASWLRPPIAACLILVAGALAIADVHAADQKLKVSENTGQVCIWRGNTASGGDIMFRPDLGCLSSSCTLPLEQTFSVTVHTDPDLEIRMNSRFVAVDESAGRSCSKDCGGTGAASVTLTRLAPGTYRLTLGGHEIGQLNTERLKGDPYNRICFGRRADRQ